MSLPRNAATAMIIRLGGSILAVSLLKIGHKEIPGLAANKEDEVILA